MIEMFRLLVTGSRDWYDYDRVRIELGRVASEHPRTTVVHGAAKGADLLAVKAAEEFGFRKEPHPADWKTHGLRAGHLRNAEMVGLGANLCLVFVLACTKASCDGRAPHDTHGTGHCAALARRAGIEVRRIEGESSG